MAKPHNEVTGTWGIHLHRLQRGWDAFYALLSRSQRSLPLRTGALRRNHVDCRNLPSGRFKLVGGGETGASCQIRTSREKMISVPVFEIRSRSQ